MAINSERYRTSYSRGRTIGRINALRATRCQATSAEIEIRYLETYCLTFRLVAEFTYRILPVAWATSDYIARARFIFFVFVMYHYLKPNYINRLLKPRIDRIPLWCDCLEKRKKCSLLKKISKNSLRHQSNFTNKRDKFQIHVQLFLTTNRIRVTFLLIVHTCIISISAWHDINKYMESAFSPKRVSLLDDSLLYVIRLKINYFIQSLKSISHILFTLYWE